MVMASVMNSGIFDQALRDGWQVELTDHGYAWEIPGKSPGRKLSLMSNWAVTPETCFEDGRRRVRWIPDRVVRGMAYDTPVLSATAETPGSAAPVESRTGTESFDFQAFNTGDYYGAVMEKVTSENITKVLYPDDETFRATNSVSNNNTFSPPAPCRI